MLPQVRKNLGSITGVSQFWIGVALLSTPDFIIYDPIRMKTIPPTQACMHANTYSNSSLEGISDLTARDAGIAIHPPTIHGSYASGNLGVHKNGKILRS